MLDAFQDFFNKGAFGAVWIAAAKAFRTDTTYIPTRVWAVPSQSYSTILRCSTTVSGYSRGSITPVQSAMPL